MKHLELFAGIGGFRRAIDLVGVDLGIPMQCVGYSEIDINAVKTYSANFNSDAEEKVIGDIVEFTSRESNISELTNFDLLTGGFPCQSFSMMGDQLGFEDPTRGQMFYRIIDILRIKRPPYVLLENVKNLFTHDHKNTFRIICHELESLGYHVFYDIFNSSNFKLAQIRNRVYIFCTLESYPKNIDFSSSAISKHLDEIITGSSLINQKTVLDVLDCEVPIKYYLSEKVKPTILSDGSAGFKSKSEINQIIARPLTATMHKMHRACQDNYYSKEFIESHGTIDSKGKSKEEIAKLEIRRLTPREALMLQGFPEEWAIKAQSKGVSDGALYKQAGNAVSVNTVYAIIHYLITNKIMKI